MENITVKSDALALINQVGNSAYKDFSLDNLFINKMRIDYFSRNMQAIIKYLFAEKLIEKVEVRKDPATQVQIMRIWKKKAR